MEWRDQGVLLSMRPHGESSAIIEVLTPSRGRHAGVVRGGGGRRFAPILQPGAQLSLVWRARLEDQLGTFAVEPLRARAPLVLGDRAALAGLSSVCALLAFALPERAPHVAMYDLSIALLDLIVAGGDWQAAYLRWELTLLEDMGFGLDLSRCAVTGERENLAYVSPRSGRAVSVAGAGEWAPRLLPLPACLLGQGPASLADLVQGLAVTGYFLEHRLAPALGDRPLPEARRRLVDILSRGVNPSEVSPSGDGQ